MKFSIDQRGPQEGLSNEIYPTLKFHAQLG